MRVAPKESPPPKEMEPRETPGKARLVTPRVTPSPRLKSYRSTDGTGPCRRWRNPSRSSRRPSDARRISTRRRKRRVAAKMPKTRMPPPRVKRRPRAVTSRRPRMKWTPVPRPRMSSTPRVLSLPRRCASRAFRNPERISSRRRCPRRFPIDSRTWTKRTKRLAPSTARRRPRRPRPSSTRTATRSRRRTHRRKMNRHPRRRIRTRKIRRGNGSAARCWSGPSARCWGWRRRLSSAMRWRRRRRR